MATAEFVHDGKAIDYTPGSDVTAGDVIVQGDLVGVKIDPQVVDPEDIIEEILPHHSPTINFGSPKMLKPNQLTPEEQNLLKLIDINPVHIDQLIQKSGLLPNQVTSLLLELELSGVIKQLPGKMFIKVA